jgi:hypothetical protein
MLTRRFIWKDTPDFGFGWCPAWMENGDPVVDFGAAHDVLEHFPRCIGGFEGEMMAFGAMCYVRRYADWRRGGILDNQASDISYFLRNVAWAEQSLEDPGPFRDTPDLMEGVEEVTEMARKAVLSYCYEEASFPRRSLREMVDARRRLPADTVRRIVGWHIKGQRKAAKRFARWGLDSYDLILLFDEIKRQFEHESKREAAEGESLVVRVNFERRDVSVTREFEPQRGYAYN